MPGLAPVITSYEDGTQDETWKADATRLPCRASVPMSAAAPDVSRGRPAVDTISSY